MGSCFQIEEQYSANRHTRSLFWNKLVLLLRYGTPTETIKLSRVINSYVNKVNIFFGFSLFC